MLLYILAFVASLIPSILVIIFLKKRRKDDQLYVKSCNSAIIRGFISALPIIVISGTLFIINAVLMMTVFKDINILVYRAFYNFIVLALAEELVKYLAFRFLLKKKINAYTWADVVAFMVIIGAAFGIFESIVYAFDSAPILMIVRGLMAGHIGYGFIMGWFYGKKLYTGKKSFGILAFLIPLFLHGLYDFSLAPELMEISDNFAFLAVGLAVFDIVLIILMIRYFVRSRKIERYNTPLIEI